MERFCCFEVVEHRRWTKKKAAKKKVVKVQTRGIVEALYGVSEVSVNGVSVIGYS